MNSLPLDEKQIFKHAYRVLGDEDLAQDFVIEIWKANQKGTIRHLGGFIRLRLRKALHKKYTCRKSIVLACELPRDDGEMEQDEILAQLAHTESPSFDMNMEALTQMETEIVTMLSYGHSVPTIAEHLKMYPRSIYTALKKIQKKNSSSNA